ncbi:hypothetical protein C0389_00010 [bacterium]|nr:hypothetical protein [bacterium]
MEKQLKLEILGSERIKILPLLKAFKDDYYLAGGTGLALQIGHRESVDFDFFALRNYDLSSLNEKIRSIFKNYKITVIQFETDTYSIILDDEIKLSFFKIKDMVILPLIQNEWFQLCNAIEIGAMKVAALFRGAYRDYVDIYFILMNNSLESILELCNKKYHEFDQALYLKALLSYDDIEETPIKYLRGKEKKPKEIFSLIGEKVKLFLAKAI